MDDYSHLSVCLLCFGLRGMYEDKDHRCKCQPIDDGWREKHWGGYDLASLVALCSLCVRNIRETASRWSWLACERCRDVNGQIGKVTGGYRHGALPLGRHSMMNSVALPSKAAADDAAVSRFAEALTDLMGVWMRFPKWRDAEARRLVNSTDWTRPDRIEVPLDDWLSRFPVSLGASVDAFCRFTGTELPEHPSLRRLSVAQLDFLYAL